jgi:hypothetical protein
VSSDGQYIIEENMRHHLVRRKPVPPEWAEADKAFVERKYAPVDPWRPHWTERPDDEWPKREPNKWPEWDHTEGLTEDGWREFLVENQVLSQARYEEEQFDNYEKNRKKAREARKWHKKNWTMDQEAHLDWMTRQGWPGRISLDTPYEVAAEGFREWRWNKERDESEAEMMDHWLNGWPKEEHEELGRQLGEKMYPWWERQGFQVDKSQNWDQNLAAYNQWGLENPDRLSYF